tara:strand:- start:139 stop:750 length:612 start_codon:yes stop_codon:yes gene_type:complete
MRTLELFAGSCSFSKVAKERGHQTFTTDIEQFGEIDYVVDIMNFDFKRLPYHPDLIWASPPCQGFSVGAIGKNWNHDHTPKTHSARKAMELVEATLNIINKLQPTYWFLENPRGKLRKLPYPTLNFAYRHTVTYCQYGDTRMKPTDIWTNYEKWESRSICKNGDSCHISAPRGSRTGTQGLKGSYERSVIPPALFEEIFESIS